MLEYIRVTKEAVWGVFNTTPGAGEQIWIQIDQSNAFSMRPEPVRYEIRSQGSTNRRVQTGSAKTKLAGNLSTFLYPEQASTLLNWGCTVSSGVIGSCTIDHAIVMEDGGPTTIYQRYLGTRVNQAQFAGTEESTTMRLSLQLTAQQTAAITGTDLPLPALTLFPISTPYLFQQCLGAMTLNGSRTEFNKLDITWKNILDATFNASRYVTRIKWCGRDVDWTLNNVYQVGTDRPNLETVTPVTGQVVFTNGTQVLTFNMYSKNYTASVKDDLPLDKVFYQELSMQCYLDASAGSDFDLTKTGSP